LRDVPPANYDQRGCKNEIGEREPVRSVKWSRHRVTADTETERKRDREPEGPGRCFFSPPLFLSVSPSLRSHFLSVSVSAVTLWPIVLSEIFDHPASALCYLSQRRVGVGGHGMAYHRQQVAVGKAVGVSEGPLQVEAVDAIDGSQAFGFGHAERMRARYSSREAPVLDFKLRTDAGGNAQALGKRLQKQVERARKQDDEMAGALVPAQPTDGLRRKTRLDLVLEALSRQTPEARRIFAAQVGFYRFQPLAAPDGGFRRGAKPAKHFA